jgi:hypothetical protein
MAEKIGQVFRNSTKKNQLFLMNGLRESACIIKKKFFIIYGGPTSTVIVRSICAVKQGRTLSLFGWVAAKESLFRCTFSILIRSFII